jgi:hypothetical protein
MIECIKRGKTESDSVPLDMSLALHKQLTRIRANGGIVFPADEAKE